MGLIQKMYGLEVKAEEMQKLVSESINNYIKEQKLELMTSPVNTDADKVDVETCDDFEMHFEVGLAPEFSITLDDKDSIPYYDIEITDEMVNTEVDMYRRRQGSMEESETYSDGDLMRGKLVELDENGQVKEGGISIDETSIMPKYFSNEDQKKLFEGAQKGDVVFNVSKAYDGKDTEIAAILKVDKEEVAQMFDKYDDTIYRCYAELRNYFQLKEGRLEPQKEKISQYLCNKRVSLTENKRKQLFYFILFFITWIVKITIFCS